MATRISPRWWIASLLALPWTLPPASLPAASDAARTTFVAVAAAVPGTAQVGSGPAHAKPTGHTFTGCFLLVLGVGGSLLAWSAGVFAPVLALLLARAALEICA